MNPLRTRVNATVHVRELLRNALGVAGVFFLVLAVSSVWWWWRPQTVLERTQKRLEKHVARRNWTKIEELLAENYSDAWGNDKSRALSIGSELLRNFLFLDIGRDPEGAITILTNSNASGEIRLRLILRGSGSPLANLIVSRVNEQPGRFIFYWQREPGWPPKWKLLRVEHENAENFR